MSKPIKIVALLTARPDRLEELRSLLENMIGPDVTPWFPPAGIRAQQLCCA